MSYQIMGILLETRDQAISELVGQFLTAGGLNDAGAVREAQKDLEKCADELLDQWSVELTGAEKDYFTGEWSHDPEFATRDELVSSIRVFELDDEYQSDFSVDNTLDKIDGDAQAYGFM